MPATGFTLAGTGANNAGAGDVAWTNPSNVTADDGSEATANIGKSATTQYLHGTNFGLAVPSGVTILGVAVRIQRRDSTASPLDENVDHTVQLIKGGTRSGDNNADLVTAWPTTATNKDYGGTTNMWGLSLSVSDVNASNFGVALRASGGADETNPAVDAVWINVYYSGAGNRAYIID